MIPTAIPWFMPAPWTCDARGKAPEKTVGHLVGQVTQVVAVTHGQETLDVATYRFFSSSIAPTGGPAHTNHLSLNYGNSRKL